LSETPGSHSNRIAWRIPLAASGLVASGQAQNEMADDVALHFGSACFDGVSAGSQVGVGPEPLIDGVRIACHELAVGTQNFLGDLLEALVELAPKYLLDRAFGAGDAGSRDTAEGAHLVVAHDLDFRAALGELLANDWIFGRWKAFALDATRKFDEARDIALEDEMQASAVGTALVHQRADCHVPSVIHFAEDVFDGDANIAKEDLVEFRFACHLAEWANFDAGRFHIHKENGEALVFCGARIRANDQLAPVADPAVTGPDFLAVHNVVNAIETRFGL